MSSPAFEAFLARLYTDEALLAAFLREPEETARAAGLDAAAIAALQTVDRDGLLMAARSFRAKRASRKPPGLATGTRWFAARFGIGQRRY